MKHLVLTLLLSFSLMAQDSFDASDLFSQAEESTDSTKIDFEDEEQLNKKFLEQLTLKEQADAFSYNDGVGIKGLKKMTIGAGSAYALGKFRQFKPTRGKISLLKKTGLSQAGRRRVIGVISYTGKNMRIPHWIARYYAIDGLVQTTIALSGHQPTETPTINWTTKSVDECVGTYNYLQPRLSKTADVFLTDEEQDEQFYTGLTQVAPSGAYLLLDARYNSPLLKAKYFKEAPTSKLSKLGQFTVGGKFAMAKRIPVALVFADGSIRLLGAATGNRMGDIPLIEVPASLFQNETVRLFETSEKHNLPEEKPGDDYLLELFDESPFCETDITPVDAINDATLRKEYGTRSAEKSEKTDTSEAKTLHQ